MVLQGLRTHRRTAHPGWRDVIAFLKSAGLRVVRPALRECCKGGLTCMKPTPSQPVEPRWNIGGDDPGACFHGRLPYDRRHFCLIARSPQGGVPVWQLFERFCVPTVTFPRMEKAFREGDGEAEAGSAVAARG